MDWLPEDGVRKWFSISFLGFTCFFLCKTFLGCHHVMGARRNMFGTQVICLSASWYMPHFDSE